VILILTHSYTWANGLANNPKQDKLDYLGISLGLCQFSFRL